MKKLVKYTLAACALAATTTVKAQNLNSAYFLDGYAFGQELNPAKEYDKKGYFNLPFLPSKLHFGLSGNIGLETFLLPNPNGKGLATYLHPDIPYDKAVAKINDDNKMLMDLNYNILSFGFHAKHSYNTFHLGFRADVGLNFPGDLFRMVKRLENENYNFSNLGLQMNSWAEIGWSYSRNVTDAIRVGAALKGLVGIAYADVKMDNLSLNLKDENRWTVNAQASAEVGIKGFQWGEPETKSYSDSYIQNHPGMPTTYQELNLDGISLDSPGIGGIGAAVDLGVEWDLGKQGWVPGLKFSAAVLDLGAIKWNEVSSAYNKGEEFVFEGFKDIEVKDNGTPIDDQIDDLSDRITDLISLQQGETKSLLRKQGCTLNVGLEYAMPFYDKLSLGILSTTRFQGVYGWNEERFSLTLSPAKWFEITGNVGVGTFGTNFGWVFNLHPKGFNLYLGMDHFPGKLSKQFIPLKFNADLTMGINFPL